ncbi:MAG: hypothetical protein V4510_03650 [bacterium]
MTIARTLVLTGLLILTAATLAPMASAQPDNVYVCAYGVNGGCEPGHIAEVHVKGHVVYVPDPCYTTAC